MFCLQGFQFQNVEKVTLLTFWKLKTSLNYITSNISIEADKDNENFLRKVIKKNSKVVAIIIKSVDESVYKNIECSESAHDMFIKLEEINQEVNELIVEKLNKWLKTIKLYFILSLIKYLIKFYEIHCNYKLNIN